MIWLKAQGGIRFMLKFICIYRLSFGLFLHHVVSYLVGTFSRSFSVSVKSLQIFYYYIWSYFELICVCVCEKHFVSNVFRFLSKSNQRQMWSKLL